MLNATLDTRKFDAAISALNQLLANMNEPLGEIQQSYLREYLQRFEQMQSPEGRAWQPLSPFYRATKPKNRDKILTLEGRLRNDLQVQRGTLSLSFGNSLPYAELMQFGGQAAKGYVPARPFQGFSGKSELVVINAITQSILKRWK